MEEFRKLAKAAFHQPPAMLNCAQSVAQLAGHDEVLAAYQAFGGGRAEGGLCGALYAALQFIPEEQREKAKEEFAQKAGALTCREIKGTSKTPCQECVAIGAWLVNQYGKKDA
ncbi:MAG: redox-active protein [Planctomycetia bacterium]|nr:redox-active protein [Planctomycetia bacterium]